MKLINNNNMNFHNEKEAIKKVFIKNKLKYTDTGLPRADMPTIKKLAGNVSKKQYGLAYEFFKEKGEEGKGIQICVALNHWLEYKQIETLLQTFIVPLQALPDQNHRIHCSMNLNTETGRISSRKPNLQNQPAYEKDKYKIRKAFCAEKGCLFVVADYGQIELRVLAHMTNCKSMIESFIAGGDFHSRTAIGMFPEIQKAVKENQVLLEWDHSKGKPPKPLIKDVFGSERRKAKGINFSIAYGKTSHGFAKDWNCSIEEAQKAVDKWYSDRPEVKEWQERVKKNALEKGWTQTLLGRYRNLSKHFLSPNSSQKYHGLRASINTPIQGGAADIVIAAMIKLHQNKRLKELGWNLLLQIHDEVIVEGPAESAEEVKNLVTSIMEHPLPFELRIPLSVDAKISDNWYEGK